ncbi:MAG: DsrE family protein [Candidatus Heimdallarchaeaceae archaeon]
MTEQLKYLFMVSRGEESKETLEPPLHLASLAAMMDIKVLMVYTAKAGLLLKKGVAENLIPQEGRRPLIETIREAKETGVEFYVCSPVLEWNNLTREDFIDEVDDIVGAMTVITESLEAKHVFSF